jgi:hypothetical protein
MIKLNDIEKKKLEYKIAKMLNVNLRKYFGRKAVKISPPDPLLLQTSYLLTINTFDTGAVPIIKLMNILNLLKEKDYEPTFIGCYEDDILSIAFIESGGKK